VDHRLIVDLWGKPNAALRAKRIPSPALEFPVRRALRAGNPTLAVAGATGARSPDTTRIGASSGRNGLCDQTAGRGFQHAQVTPVDGLKLLSDAKLVV